MKTKRLLSLLTASAMVATLFAGCGGGSDKDAGSTADSGSTPADSGTSQSAGVEKFSVWASGSDNVRQIFEKLVSDFNANSEYAGKYEAELQFVLSGSGGAQLKDMLVTAALANQDKTDYDVVELGDDDITNCVDKVGEEMFEMLDTSKIDHPSFFI